MMHLLLARQPKFQRGLRLGLIIAAFSMASACANRSSNLYYWGSYEDLIYQMYQKPGEATPEVQVERLTRDLAKAEAKGLPTPPGVYAHLGVMYAALGMAADAEQAFREEKLRFPESATLIDGMLARAAAQHDRKPTNER